MSSVSTVMATNQACAVRDTVTPTSLPVKRKATEALRGVVGTGTLICIDGSAALRGAAKTLGAAYHSVPVSYGPRVVDGVYHVQSVNSYHERLKTWLNRDRRGIATKYLPNYLAWMRMSEWYKGDLRTEYFVISGPGRQLINT